MRSQICLTLTWTKANVRCVVTLWKNMFVTIICIRDKLDQKKYFYNNIVAGAYNFCSMHDSCTYVSWHNNIVVGLFLSYLVVGLGLTWHACNEWLEKKQRDVCSVRCRRLFSIVWHKYMCTCYCYVCAGGAMFSTIIEKFSKLQRD